MSQKELLKAIETTDNAMFDEVVSRIPDDPLTSKINLENCEIKGKQIGAIRIHSINCANMEWEACIFDGTTFDGVDLEGSFFNGCTFHDCIFKNIINFSDVAFDGCVWQKSGIIDPDENNDLNAFSMTNCQFKECQFRNLHFVEGVLESVSFTGGCIDHVDGEATLKSVVLRSVEVNSFDTSEMEMTNCTASGCAKVPKGFVNREGRRCRV